MNDAIWKFNFDVLLKLYKVKEESANIFSG